MTRDKEKKPSKDQLLLEAARLGQVQQLELLLKEFQQKSKKRSNPLASLRRVVGPNSIRDPATGFTCLHHAALNGHTQCVQLILSSGCKVNSVDYKGSSALHLAAWAGNVQVVKLLIDHCQTSMSRMLSGDCGQAYEVSASKTLPDDYQELDINLCNNDNQTPLSLAAQFGHHQVVAELLIHAANVHLRNNQLESPLDLACLNGRFETVRLLLNFAPELIDELQRSHATDTSSRVPGASPRHRLGQAGAETTSSPVTSCKQHQRRPSGSGWSSLLRAGKSRPAESAAAAAAASSSPQPSLASDSNRSLVCDSGRLASPNRRATLGNEPAKWPHMNQLAASEWQKLSLDQPVPGKPRAPRAGDKLGLLDHSPLHYAVRRGHLQIVDLLLNSYEANVMQVTSLGGVLHEVALSHCFGVDRAGKSFGGEEDPREMLALIFNHLSFRQRIKSEENTLDKFLSLSDWQRKSVFDFLNDFNNGSAQRLRRVICEFSERLTATSSLAAGSHPDSVLTIRPLGQPQQQPMHSLFNSNQQINSFVTMKRVPKQRKQQAGASQQQQAQLPFDANPSQRGVPLSTQTIDRRKFGAKSGRDNAQPNPIDWSLHANSTRQTAPVAQRQQAPVSMTRSVSNLINQTAQNNQMNEAQLMCANSSRGPALHDHRLDQQQHPLVRSQTDCSHLMGKLLRADPVGSRAGDFQDNPRATTNDFVRLNQESLHRTGVASQQQHSATIDRKAINRHYHVYEHEFYPPRILNNAAEHSKQANLNQLFRQPHHQAAIAVVPPLNRSGSTEASFNAVPEWQRLQQQHQVTRVASFSRRDPAADGCRPADGFQQLQQLSHKASSDANSRLSLNIDCLPDMQMKQSSTISGDYPQQQRQMDRFVARHSSRKSTGSNSRRLDDELEVNVCQQQDRQQSLDHHSQSSDSNHSFEATRRALVRDFDQMIGRELLSRNHGQLMNNSREQLLSSSSSLIQAQQQQPKRTILTGVSLDMDTRGERLIVSGTRITLPASRDSQLSTSNGQLNRPPPSSAATKLTAQSQATQTSPSPASSQISCRQFKVGQRSAAGAQLADSRPTSCASSSSSASSSVIYDLPSAADSAVNHNSTTTSRTSSNLQQISAVLMTPRQQLNIGKQSQQQRGAGSSKTRPPQEKPPPPPPLRAQLDNCSADEAGGNVVTNPQIVSRSDIVESDLQQHLRPAQSGQSSLAGQTSSSGPDGGCQPTSMANQSEAVAGRPRQYAAHPTSQQLVLAIQSNAEDSGVCTSNSPSSMSHDSTERQSSNEQQSSSCSLDSRGLKHQQQVIQFDSSGPTSIEMGPPSPQTAQLSIEEALLPLDVVVTHEAANQTSFASPSVGLNETESSDDGVTLAANEMTGLPARQSSSMGAIVGWLNLSDEQAGSRQRIGERKQKGLSESSALGDYENCLILQRQLDKQRCQPINDLSPISAPHCDRSSCSSTSGAQLDACDGRAECRASNYASDYETGDMSIEPDCDRNTPVKLSESQLVSRSKKEVLLKVVVDERTDQESSGDEVFYIEPSELKKISGNKGSRGQKSIDMETLTDEELCASIDRKSGLIRFTLRKRRAESRDLCDDDDNQLARASLDACASNNSFAGATPDEQVPQSSLKKTKLASSELGDESEMLDSTDGSAEIPIVSKPIEADIEQTVTTTSSSSSKDSIKSIVSLKQYNENDSLSRSEADVDFCRAKVEARPEVDHDRLESASIGAAEDKENLGESASHGQREPGNRTAEVDAGSVPRQEHDEPGSIVLAETARNKLENVAPPGQSSEEAKAGAMVALEAASVGPLPRVAQANPSESRPSVAYKPIAAARKSRVMRQRTDGGGQDSTEANESVDSPAAGSLVETKTAGKVSDIRQRLEQNAAASQQAQQPAGKRALRWPPPARPAGEQPEPARDVAAASGRVSANRLSFQRLIEERGKAPGAGRPKPAPPAKPANILLAGKIPGLGEARGGGA